MIQYCWCIRRGSHNYHLTYHTHHYLQLNNNKWSHFNFHFDGSYKIKSRASVKMYFKSFQDWFGMWIFGCGMSYQHRMFHHQLLCSGTHHCMCRCSSHLCLYIPNQGHICVFQLYIHLCQCNFHHVLSNLKDWKKATNCRLTVYPIDFFIIIIWWIEQIQIFWIHDQGLNPDNLLSSQAP